MFVEIDGSTMRFSRCDAFEYKGSHSGETRRGMEMVFTSYSNSDNEQIEALLRNREVVTVADPVARRKYEAKIDRSWSSSYQEGRPTKSYQFTLREIDRAKAFPSLQIEGETFAVLRNTETDRGDGGVIAHVLLRLSPEEFETFHSLIKPGTVQILRQGVDDEPVERRFGRVASWSRHEEDSQTYYKQVVNFYDLEQSNKGLDIPLGTEHRALSQMVVALTVRFTALLEMLESSGVINKEQVATIKQEQWRELMDERRRISIWTQLREVGDAEEEYCDYETS